MTSEAALETSTFELSRIYGRGWNAAKKLLADGRAANAKQAAKLNPYSSGEERARWTKGFEEGLQSRTGAHSAARAGSWRPNTNE